MSKSDSSVEILLSTLRDNFLAEIPDRCDSIEDNILALEKEDVFPEAFKDLFRSIHSLKGSGGTMGLPIITAISHQFEDMLSDIDGKFDNIKKNSIDSMLKYNDLLKSTAVNLVNKNFDEEFVRIELEKLKTFSRTQKISCMIVEPSKMMLRVVTNELENLALHIITVDNGLGALDRLLNEKFDILITSKELPILNGIALICALRKSETKNAKIPCILTTSKDIDSLALDGLDISSVVKKDKELVKKLTTEINNISPSI